MAVVFRTSKINQNKKIGSLVYGISDAKY